jgi:aldose 1-epimerase
VITRERFGADADGTAVDAYTLRNGSGASVQFLSYGGIIRSLCVPDGNGTIGDVVLGFDTFAEYVDADLYMGALIGRYANRIAGAHFDIDGRRHHVSRNEGRNCLHGGAHGFHTVHWEVEPFDDTQSAGARLRHVSPDGSNGFPGALSVCVTYQLHHDNSFVVTYEGTASETTPVSLTQHMYFNLSGGASAQVLDHELTVFASHFTPVDGAQIPTGELRPVRGTPFDFTTSTPIGARLHDRDAQLVAGGGYDHNYVLDQTADARRACARLSDPVSGRILTMSTTEPGLQLCTGNSLGNGVLGKGGVPMMRHAGVALETQRFPDSPNQPHFPSCLVHPDVPFRSSTTYAFSVSHHGG